MAGIGLPIYTQSWLRTFQDWSARLTEVLHFVTSHREYTQNETHTGETWINGQPILRKVVNFGALPNATTKVIPHGIQYHKIIKIAGYAISGTFTFPLPFASSTAANAIGAYVDKGDLVVFCGVDRTDFTESYFVIEYVKE